MLTILLMTAAAALAIQPVAVPQSECDCGYVDLADPAGNVWTDLFVSSFVGISAVDPKVWVVSTDVVNNTDGMDAFPGHVYTKQNVVVTPQGVQLLVQPQSDTTQYVQSAELISKSMDFGFGSYHMTAQMTNVPGTVGSMYTFLNITEEVDIEYVSRAAGTQPSINFAVKPQIYGPGGIADPSTLIRDPLDFDPSLEVHDYSFLWTPASVQYAIDGAFMGTIVTNVPQVRGLLVLTQWSDGDPSFTAGPPATVSTMLVAEVWAYYNSTAAGGQIKCQLVQEPCTRNTTLPDGQQIPSPTATESAIFIGPPTTTSTTSSSHKASSTGSSSKSGAVSILPSDVFFRALVTASVGAFVWMALL